MRFTYSLQDFRLPPFLLGLLDFMLFFKTVLDTAHKITIPCLKSLEDDL